jgi:hypothetical protein
VIKTHIKPEIRILGIDDSPLVSDKIMVIGALMRGGDWLEGVLRTYIDKDGMDATIRIVDMVESSKHLGQIRAIMLNGVTFGGFNVVDIQKLYEKVHIPVIVIMRDLPDMEKIKKALKNLNHGDVRYRIISGAGTTESVKTQKRGKPVYIQYAGISCQDAKDIVIASSTHSRIPEPVRVAHLIATGIILGESKKRA